MNNCCLSNAVRLKKYDPQLEKKLTPAARLADGVLIEE